MNKGYIYIGQYYHKHGKDLQELGLTEKKIGKTINLEKRERGLNSTKMTIGYTIVAAWAVNDMDSVEKGLHTAFDDNRLDGEWFDDVNDDIVQRVSQMMNLFNLGTVEILPEAEDRAAVEVQKQATTNFSVEYNDKIYDSNGSQIMVDVFNDVLKNHFIEDEWIKTHNRALRYEAWENPQKPGALYTKELDNGLHVVTCISNKRKKLNLESLARELNLNLKVNYEYIKR